MSTKQIAQAAVELVKNRLNDEGFSDISDSLHVQLYSSKQVARLQNYGDWVGMYIRGSASSGIVHTRIAYEKHNGLNDMVDTIAHEAGHGLWELVDAVGKKEWLELSEYHKWGKEESFADNLMYLLRGDTHLMCSPQLWNALTSIK